MKKGKKGLFMTILILILFMLILGELMTFALLTYNYNSLDQASAIGSSSLNYGKALQSSANLFANSSLKSAIAVLANYELNSSMRQSNLISNTSQYLSYLVTNGTLPNVAANSIAANYLTRGMKNLTLQSYNASVGSLLNLGSSSIKINQTRVQIFQSSSYTITLSYLENVLINSSTAGKFSYSILVNATLPLNNTPDLYYYQQGITRNIRFGSLANLTNVIGSINATNGNYLGLAYGPVYKVPTGAAGLTCASLASMISANEPAFSFAPYNQMLIIATSNAIGITNGGSGPNCAAQYGGLITYSINSISNPPAIPWLLYPSATNLLGSLGNGQQLLLLGNTLSTLNIQNLVVAAGNGYYFASPFAPSYLDLAQGSVTKQNQNGIFKFSNFGATAGAFNGVSSYVQVGSNSLPSGSAARSVFAWVYPTAGSRYNIIFEYGTASSGNNDAVFYINNAGNLAFDGWGNHDWSTLSPSINSWHLVGFSYAAGANQITFYLDGQANTNSLQSGALNTVIPVVDPANIGQAKTQNLWFQGSIANVQAYGSALNSIQASQLYQEGKEGLPVPSANIVGWWTLNGNANDISGQLNNGIPTNVFYSLPANYMRDSILPSVSSTSLLPIPGLLNCNSNSQCSSSSVPHVYIGSMPLEISSALAQVGSFNGQGYITTSNSASLNFDTANPFSISAWIRTNALTENTIVGKIAVPSSAEGYSFEINTGGALRGLFWDNVGNFKSFSTTNTVNNNVWHNVVEVYNGIGVALYIDSVSQSVSSSGTITGSITSTGSLTIGTRFGTSPFSNFNGSISNVQIYNIALTASQVQSLYNFGIYDSPINTNSLVGWWPLNGNANDYSGYSNNGINTNVVYGGFFGAYNSPGLSTISSVANEWQAIGIPRSG